MGNAELDRSIQIFDELLDVGIRNVADVCAIAVSDTEANPSKMISKEAQKERLEKQICDELRIFKTRVENGIFQIMKKVTERSIPDNELHSSEFIDDIAKLTQIPTLIEESPESYFEQLNEKTVIEITNVSEQTFETLYQAACELYNEEQYEHAADAFGFLTLINSNSYSSWLGLAHSQYFLKRYEEALVAYAWCCEVDPTDPQCHLFSSYCYEEIHELDNAINAIELALLVTEDDPEYQELHAQLTHEKQRLTAKQKS